METIFALASARGKAGVAVIRISGPEAWDTARALAGDLPEARRAGLRRLRLGGQDLDDALVLTFASGSSFTGEESAELHVHGSIATVSAVLVALGQQTALRMAEPGEFTRRALENGRLDLAQVEGLADLIEAETEAQRRQALRVLSGAVGDRAEGWRRDLVRASALLEASIDFSDEDIPDNFNAEVLELVVATALGVERELAGVGAAERVREGFEVAIVGAPNAGKSTLLNALAGREAAITSEIAGTTRDIIEVRMDIGGLAVTLLDTAGLRDTEEVIEGIGIERALARADAADMRIFLRERGDDPLRISPRRDDIVLRSKADLGVGSACGDLAVSAVTGQGMDLLIARIGAVLEGRVANAGVMTRARHRMAMERALGALESAANEVRGGLGRVEIAAEHLRHAVRALDSLIGRVDVEDLLDDIFASFCIGK